MAAAARKKLAKFRDELDDLATRLQELDERAGRIPPKPRPKLTLVKGGGA